MTASVLKMQRELVAVTEERDRLAAELAKLRAAPALPVSVLTIFERLRDDMLAAHADAHDSMHRALLQSASQQAAPAVPESNRARAARIVALWPKWKRNYRLTKHSPQAAHGELVEAGGCAPAVIAAPAVQDGDDFNGTTPHLIQCMEALVRLDADGVLVPHGIGRDASKLLSAAANRLRKQPAPSVPEEWQEKLSEIALHCTDSDTTDAIDALLQSADHSEKSLEMVTLEFRTSAKDSGICDHD